MKANARAINSNDEGVSPVIAVILMVAITVVLAATVYVWVSGFASDTGGPESASATAQGLDLDNNGDVEWIKLTLVRGENAPYDQANDVVFTIVLDSGIVSNQICESAETAIDTADAAELLIAPPPTVNTLRDCSNFFFNTDAWDVGENLFVPCRAAGNHAITVGLRGTTILDSTVSCDEPET